jgi:hypothetical protein
MANKVITTVIVISTPTLAYTIYTVHLFVQIHHLNAETTGANNVI